MANITRYDPFREITRFDPFRNFDDLFKGFLVRPVSRELEPEIKMDVSEDDKAYTIRAEIPGVKKEDIKVSVDGNQVSISAEVKKEKEEKEGRKVVHSERYYGKAYRSFTLDHDVDPDAAKAKYSDGVLELTLPKKTGTARKELTVS
ncbi:MAG: heat-shock protein Hsp20 [Betaproteobacteria bacterium RIFCSPLOWO2_12_FULL_62_58]|nr:MAG: heat-shock protein Hsp20 [Betaproteobacteria bacterium RIFCSPLOWO2_12_FULL_62_58]